MRINISQIKKFNKSIVSFPYVDISLILLPKFVKLYITCVCVINAK